jgi:hypothetical protein
MFPQKICSFCTDRVLAAAAIKKKVIETDLLLRAEIKDETQIKTELGDPIPEITLLSSEELVEISMFGEEVVRDEINLEVKCLRISKKPEKVLKKIETRYEFKFRFYKRFIFLKFSTEQKSLRRTTKEKTKFPMNLTTNASSAISFSTKFQTKITM